MASRAVFNANTIKTGHFFEHSGGVLGTLTMFLGASGGLWFIMPKLTNNRPATLDPEWILESQKLGNVTSRIEVAPVYRNPIRNHIPGYVLGPEDAEKAE